MPKRSRPKDDSPQDKVKWQVGSCVRAIILVYPGGGVYSRVVTCQRWACESCAANRVAAMTLQLSEAVDGGPLYAAEITHQQWGAAKKTAAREYASYLSVHRWGVGKEAQHGDVYFVSDVALAGRDWELKPVETDEVSAVILNGRRVRRSDWSKGWKPEQKERGHALGRVSVPPSLMGKVMQRAGVDEKTGRIPGLDDAMTAERIQAAAEVVTAEWERQKKLGGR